MIKIQYLKQKLLPDDSIQTNNSEISNSSLGLGIIFGIIIGVTIGIVFIFIIRQKHD